MPAAGSKKDPAKEKAAIELMKRLKWGKTGATTGEELRKHKSGKGYLCPIPYGQWAEGHQYETDLEYQRRVRTYWKETVEEANLWPTELMSFEAWCGMTCFDRNADDGGPAFQRLMLMLLGASGVNVTLDAWVGADDQMDFEQSNGRTYMYDANRREYGPMFNTPDAAKKLNGHLDSNGNLAVDHTWWEGIDNGGNVMGLLSDTVDKTTGGNVWESTGFHLSVHARPQIMWKNATYKKPGGGDPVAVGQSTGSIGLNLGNKSGAADTIQGTGAKKFVQGHHQEVFSKHDWIMKSLLQTGSAGKGGHSGSQTAGSGLNSPGLDKVSNLGRASTGANTDCWEVTAIDEPCMYVQNSLAAIYGLYYYPNCNADAYNWHVQEEVPGVGTFDIQFRCPNPMYGPPGWWATDSGQALENGRLFVYEELNPKNREFLDRHLRALITRFNQGDPDRQMMFRGPHEYVGGPHGLKYTDKKDQVDEQTHKFEVPPASRKITTSSYRDAGHEMESPWMWLVNKDAKMQIAPFWTEFREYHKLATNTYKAFDRGKKLRDYNIRVAGHDGDYTKTVKEEGAKEHANVAKTGNMVFGFRMSQAYLLYPHKIPQPQLLVRNSKTNFHTRVVGYMTEPTGNNASLEKEPGTGSLAQHLTDWATWRGKDKTWWRQKLLADETLPVGLQKPASSNAKGKGKAPAPAPMSSSFAQSLQGSGGGQGPEGAAAAAAGPSSSFTTNPGPGQASAEALLDTQEVDGGEVDEENEEREDSEIGVGSSVVGNQDIDLQKSMKTNLKANVNTVATTFGIPGMSLAETLRDCLANDRKYAKGLEFDANDIAKFQSRKPGTKLSAQETQIRDALEACGLLEPEALPEGAIRSRRADDVQCHWRTARHAPWCHEDCYEPARLQYTYETMTTDTRAEYEQRYGHDAHLIQQAGDNLKRITGVNVNWGAKKRVMDKTHNLLETTDELHCLNFARIICIFLDTHGVGRFNMDEKRRGMMNGLQIGIVGEQGVPQPVTIIPNSRKVSKGHERLWGPVFDNNPMSVGLSEALLKCLDDYAICKRDVTDDTELSKCLEQIPDWKTELNKVGSPMTVAEWVTTPWHLMHLPYQRQYAVFRDGECFSEGCKRCSRTFYEYAYHVHAPITGTKGTFSYPQDMWYRENRSCAPVPLHDPTFWANASDDGKHYWENAQSGQPSGAYEGGGTQALTTKGKKPLKPASEAELQGIEKFRAPGEVERDARIEREYAYYTGGQMAWPTYELRPERVYHGDKNRKVLLEASNKNTTGPFFRRYLNSAYSSGKTTPPGILEDAKQNYYTSIHQGYMFDGRHKVIFGHKDFRLSRSHKYGNVCRDCASILERAPALLVRNNRWQFSGGLTSGNNEAVHAGNVDYWMLVQNDLLSPSNLSVDAFLMKSIREHGLQLSTMTEYERDAVVRAFDEAAIALKEGFNARFKMPSNWTKLIEQPTIHIQGSLTTRRDADKPAQIEEAIRDLNKLMDPERVNFKGLNLKNPALQDIVREAERKYMHNQAYAQVESTKQFDSDVQRTEYRNCVIRYSARGLFWLNPPGVNARLEYDRVEAHLTGRKLPDHGKKLGKLTENRYLGKKRPLLGEEPVVYYNCLITDQYDPDLLDPRRINEKRGFLLPQALADYRVEVYLATRQGPGGRAFHPDDRPTQWKGDGFVCDRPETDEIWQPTSGLTQNLEQSDGRATEQQRALRQSRLFITYSLHRPITDEASGRVILEKMADAIYKLFGEDRWLSQMIVCGKMLKTMDLSRATKGDNVSRAMWGIIDRTNKTEAMQKFYGSRDTQDPRTSYVYDTYETHVDKIDIDAGCEVGPKMGHPHFHLLLTINHFSYVQFDYFKMNAFLEIMFRGIETFHGWGTRYKLPDNFYGDNENPYVDVRLYPQDNWREILAAYVRKNAIPSIVEVESSRRVPGTAEKRRMEWLNAK